ncbi:hypothetical protein ACHAC9_18945 [Massilia sp. CMS3.1]|uniref:hypothetical protein n=1 Tax=Massilia sp. CMS3.1 TaxID=3373083 RepID=UPI003EE71430
MKVRMQKKTADTLSNKKTGASLKVQQANQVSEEDNAELVAQLRQDAMDRRSALFRAGELIDSSFLCERLGITHCSLRNAVREKRMFGIRGPGRAMWYPSFFVTSSLRRCELEQVSVALGDLAGDAKWQFFTTPKYSLDKDTPLAALERGKLIRVLLTAREYNERRFGR